MTLFRLFHESGFKSASVQADNRLRAFTSLSVVAASASLRSMQTLARNGLWEWAYTNEELENMKHPPRAAHHEAAFSAFGNA